MPGKLEFEFSTASGSQTQRKQDEPFVMLVMGDFGGHSESHADDPSWLMQVPVRKIDLDSVAQLWVHIKPRLDLSIEDLQVCIEPLDIDDFHPDQLYRSLPVFAELRQIRKRLLDPATASDSLSELLKNQPIKNQPVKNQPTEAEPDSSNTTASEEDGNQMFERLLGGVRPGLTADSTGSDSKTTVAGLDRLLQKAVAAHIVHQPDPRVDSAIDAVDKAIAEIMRQILHHPDFEALEGVWRSLYELIYASEFGEELVLKVCSVSKQELLAGLPQSMETIHASGLYQLLVGRQKRAADDVGYSLLVCNYFFGGNADDVALLASLGSVAELSNAAVIGAAKSELLGCTSVALEPDFSAWSKVENPLWQQLRNSPMANRIGLALPRILGRLPYGNDYEKVVGFEFEEQLSAEYEIANHANFLWLNPSLYLAGLLAQSFTAQSWNMQPEDHTDIGGLPVYTYTLDGEKYMLPTAETLLSERSAEAVMQLGLMPIVSFRNRDLARLIRFQSIADPLAALRGPW